MDISRKTKPIMAIQTFYVLMELDEASRRNPACGIAVHRQFISYSDRLAKAFFDYLAMICMGEARYAKVYSRIAVEQFRNYSTSSSGRQEIYENADIIDPIGSIPTLRKVFGSEWKSTSYGGQSWLELVETYARYGEVSSSCFIDMVVNKQHNSGTVFSKPCLFYEEDRGSLQDFLNYRREESAFSYGYLRLFNVAYDALKKALKVGLLRLPGNVNEEYQTIENCGNVILPDPVEWGFIKLESCENYHDDDVCPECGYSYDECECWHCPSCGEVSADCICEKCMHCGCVEYECSCDEFMTYEKHMHCKNEKETPHGVYETYVETAKDCGLSRPV